MVIDPVCGMYIDEKSAAATCEFDGKIYYFCIQICKTAFMKDPDRYIQTENHLAGRQDIVSHYQK